MAAYKKGVMSKPKGLSGTDRGNISNANLKNRFAEINKSFLDKGYTPTSFSPIGISEGILPTYAKTTTASPSGSFTTGGQVGQSFNKMIGGSGFGGQGISSMGELEAASMRLADAASRRNIAEREAEAELQAKQQGYMSFAEMQRDIRSKRREQEQEEEIRRRGYVKIGGQWVMPAR